MGDGVENVKGCDEETKTVECVEEGEGEGVGEEIEVELDDCHSWGVMVVFVCGEKRVELRSGL